MTAGIQRIHGDILTLKRGILVHGCNCFGVMGSGIARLIRDKWPGVFQVYREAHLRGRLLLGDVLPVAYAPEDQGSLVTFEPSEPPFSEAVSRHLAGTFSGLPEELIVVNAMTQYDFGGDPSRVYVDYDALEAAFKRVYLLSRDSGLPVHFPAIGCGLANGQWSEVEKRIEAALGPSIEKTLWLLP